MRKLFRFNVTKDTGIAAVAGIVMIALSFLMLPFGGDSVRDTVVSFVLRDVLTGTRWYLIMALICISLIISDTEHFFIYLLAILS